ncbi:O-antigen ligase [Flavobacterium cucumis]|uniref:O-antigen ligase n=2 Tax=Flavobacterium cucumis TaxID=416016 RepID=A0A1M7ZU92_9FLAO|nr:O-antigen ligase [Flavobacterium cucumis]
MKITLNKIYTFLFFTSLFFLPFNSWEGIKEFGEFKRESSAIFLLIGFLILVVEILCNNKILIPYKNYLFRLVLFFLIWCLIATILNFPSVFTAYFKQTSGATRFLRQYFALILSSVLFCFVYTYSIAKMTLEQVLFSIRKVFLISFFIVFLYGFLEILYSVFGFHPAYLILRFFDYFPFTEYDSDINGRISSVCWEPPALATYLITISGWMFSYVLTHKGILKYVPSMMILLLTYYSGSRTALVVILIQLIVFLFIVLNRKQKMKTLFYLSVISVLFFGFVFLSDGNKVIRNIEKKIESLDFKGNLKSNISNQSRFGIQYANLVVFSENPIIGVGFGQQGYHAINHYPAWAKKDNYEFKQIYLNKKNPTFAPGYNLYVRLLAETGIVGLGLFLSVFFIIYKQLKKGLENFTSNDKVLITVLIVSFVGFTLNWLQIDTFRVYGFWFCLAIMFLINKEKA